MQRISSNRSFGGQQQVFEHNSESTHTPMRFSAYMPPQVNNASCPALFWLSGLTCTEENFTVKAGAQRMASELGLIIIAPDTSPRGDVPDEPDAYDLGKGAGFYVDATQDPWQANYRMHTYVACELPALIKEHFPVDADRLGIFGHSMGGHGALVMHLRYPQLFKSVSAYAPIVAPTQVPWGHKVLSAYLGDDRENWRDYDACELVARGASDVEILIDQGTDDEFLADQLKPELFVEACRQAGQALNLRMQSGYDHSYYCIASFMEDHLRHHAQALSNSPT